MTEQLQVYRCEICGNIVEVLHAGAGEWIEIVVDGKAYRQFLSPGDAPEAVFTVSGDDITAREYCNVHGLWKG